MYWIWNYDGVEWNSERFLLRVYFSQKTLLLKPAYKDYGFPEIRTADGNIVIFSASIGLINESNKLLETEIEEIKNKLKSEFYGSVSQVVQKYRDKVQHTIAVQKLEKGYLANNLGKIEFSRRLYTKPIFDNSGELYTITQASNFGYRKAGKTVTTKGISQLDFFKDVGLFNKVANASRDLVSIFGFSDLLKFAMDEHPETIMIGFAPADFLSALVAPALIESIKESWDTAVFDLAEKAKDKGLRGINKFLQSPGALEKRYGFNIIEINQIVLDKLLKGEIKNLEDLQNLQRENKYVVYSSSYILFYYKQKQKERDEELTIIDSIFINF